ncbi:GNAT family N-acetyltransferase [Podospora aff. communis PSN243]|uniref:GNAT family N-acetyltransferase n=1 Tax=Podospora aff. communis PSN243 TaxID=3040156 RepID=A0AAV9GJZ2_9PEZI|nr:GNAT family N-acetyltransferase [Podospora aff. communis PSN243]
MTDSRSSLSNIVIRPATDDDRDTLYKIHCQAMYDVVKQTWGWDEDFQVAYWKREWDPSEFRIIVIDGKVVGSMTVVDRPHEIRLAGFELEPDFQGRGIGSQLLKGLQEEAVRRGLPLALGVLLVNTRARALYERHGFIEYERSDIKAEMRWDP